MAKTIHHLSPLVKIKKFRKSVISLDKSLQVVIMYIKARRSRGGELMKKTQTISIRMPFELFEYVKNIARNERRSISQQVILYVEMQAKKAEPVGAEK